MAVGLPGGDLEAAGQDSARKGDDDEIAHLEVMGAADDSPGAGVVVVFSNVNPAVADRLPVAVSLDLVRHHTTDHERTGHIGARVRDRLDLKTRSDQGLPKAARIKIIG